MALTRSQQSRRREQEALQNFLDSRDVVEEVLKSLDPTSRTLLRRVNRGFREAVDASGLPRAGGNDDGDARLNTVDFFDSVERICWAKANGSPWDHRVVARLCPPVMPVEVLKWAVENGAPCVCDRFANADDLVGMYNPAECTLPKDIGDVVSL